MLDNPATSKGVPQTGAVASVTRGRGVSLTKSRGRRPQITEPAAQRRSGRIVSRLFGVLHDRQRGQSMVEFALILPLLLLLALIAVDFGRIYLGYINLQNMARIAANFAANNPNAWLPGNTDPAKITQYQNQILADAAATNCTLNPALPPSPTFTDTNGDGNSRGIGDKASVALTCRFSVITPIISKIIGGTVNVSASSVFPVKSAISQTSSGGGVCLFPAPGINANPLNGPAPLTVNFMDSSGGGTGTAWSWDFGDGTTSSLRDPGDKIYTAQGNYTVTLTVTNACGSKTTNPGTVITVTPASQPAQCVVPDFNNVKRLSQAPGKWGLPKPPGAGFTTTILDGPGAPSSDYNIHSQSIVANTVAPCDSVITVNKN
jgi:Flp pilus assembly protein TadG